MSLTPLFWLKSELVLVWFDLMFVFLDFLKTKPRVSSVIFINDFLITGLGCMVLWMLLWLPRGVLLRLNSCDDDWSSGDCLAVTSCEWIFNDSIWLESHANLSYLSFLVNYVEFSFCIEIDSFRSSMIV